MGDALPNLLIDVGGDNKKIADRCCCVLMALASFRRVMMIPPCQILLSMGSGRLEEKGVIVWFVLKRGRGFSDVPLHDIDGNIK